MISLMRKGTKIAVGAGLAVALLATGGILGAGASEDDIEACEEAIGSYRDLNQAMISGTDAELDEARAAMPGALEEALDEVADEELEGKLDGAMTSLPALDPPMDSTGGFAFFLSMDKADELCDDLGVDIDVPQP